MGLEQDTNHKKRFIWFPTILSLADMSFLASFRQRLGYTFLTHGKLKNNEAAQEKFLRDGVNFSPPVSSLMSDLRDGWFEH